MAFETGIFDSVTEIDASAWNACFPGEAECHAYYVACEQGGRSCRMSTRVTCRSAASKVSPGALARIGVADVIEPEADLRDARGSPIPHELGVA